MTVHGRFPGQPLAPDPVPVRTAVKPERIGGASRTAIVEPTPGPWSVHPDFPTLVVGPGMTLVARTDTKIMDEAIAPERERQNPANARLIAVAPRMAALLLSAYQHASHGGPKRGDVEDVLREAGLIS